MKLNHAGSPLFRCVLLDHQQFVKHPAGQFVERAKPEKQIRAHIGSLVLCEPGIPMTIDDLLMAAAKRKFGCYAMPIVWGNKLIGRIDPKLDRDNRKLIVNGIWLEPGIAGGKELIQELACMLSRFASFLDAEKNVEIMATYPKYLRTELAKLL